MILLYTKFYRSDKKLVQSEK